MRSIKSIIYVNYSPYENSGKILDYILENFENVFIFSLGFYNLKNKKNYNNLSIYKERKLQKTYSLFQLPIPSKYVFLFIPIRSIITFVEIILYSVWLKIKYRKIDVYFTVNAFTAWIGTILKRVRIIGKTIFWVWDYYPPRHKNPIVTIMRWIYWQFDKVSSHSDRVAFVNKRILISRKKLGIIPKNKDYPIVPIGTDKIFIRERKVNSSKVKFGFIGVVKESQGLGIVFDSAEKIMREFPKASYEIVGSGPDEKMFKSLAKKSSIKTKFYGYLEGELFNKILKSCHIGIATYTPSESNVSAYGDPGKVKRYLTLGIPVIATDIFEFSSTIEKEKAGVVIKYDPKSFANAVKKITANYPFYRKNAYALGKKFYYRKLYPKLFNSDIDS